jgi:hypothetical protein
MALKFPIAQHSSLVKDSEKTGVVIQQLYNSSLKRSLCSISFSFHNDKNFHTKVQILKMSSGVL